MDDCSDSICYAASTPCHTVEPYYNLYKDRLESFNDWRYDFIVEKTELARNGFYYLHVEDKVQCHECKIILRKWSIFDCVKTEHLKYSPFCKYLRHTMV